MSNESIKIFGKGEEMRDHVHIDDVSRIIVLSILRVIIAFFHEAVNPDVLIVLPPLLTVIVLSLPNLFFF